VRTIGPKRRIHPVQIAPNGNWATIAFSTLASHHINVFRLIILSIKSTFYQTLAIAAWRFLWPRSCPLACMEYGTHSTDGVQASSRPFPHTLSKFILVWTADVHLVFIHFAARRSPRILPLRLHLRFMSHVCQGPPV